MDPLDKIFTAEEAAERFRITNRALIKFARDIGACSVINRKYLFSEADLLTIWQALRAEPIRYRGRAVHVPARKALGDAYEQLRKIAIEQQWKKLN